MMRNIKLTIAYDGTDFRGWQMQPGLPTIQGAITDVLSRITRGKIALHGSGRTDAGVHALGQVANFQTGARLTPGEFQHALNGILPGTIRIYAAEEVPQDFHARHSALAKTYRYRVFSGQVLPPFLSRYVFHYPGTLDESAMYDAARHFVGEHDFTTFSGNPEMSEPPGDEGQSPSPIRTVHSVEILREGDEVLVQLRGRSFLRYMVRKMTGTLLEVGRGKLRPGAIPQMLAARDRSKVNFTAPPHGLYLATVEYGGSAG